MHPDNKSSNIHDPEHGAVPPSFDVSADDLVKHVAEHDRQWVRDFGGASALAAALQTDLKNGISSDEIRGSMDARLSAFGPNRFKYPPPKSFFRLVLDAFNDQTILILCVAAIVSLGLSLGFEERRNEHAYLEGTAILVVVIIVVLVQAVIDRNKEAKFRQLNSVKDQYQVQVRRAGNPTSLSADELVVGDIITVTAGDKLPADALLVDGANLKVNEAAMTGEPIDIDKSPDGDMFLLSGTSVSEGVGTALIVAVGERSQWGVILKALIVEPEDTPLQQRLDKLAWTIGKIGIVFATLTFIVSILRWIANSVQENHWDGFLALEAFIDAVTIVVVSIPEGLPLAITLGLAFAMRKMMKDNNMVRRLEACETMGSATQLNADKTGTLTQNRMTVVESYWQGQHVIYEGAMNDPNADSFMTDQFRQAICVGMSVNTQANLEFSDGGLIHHLGNKTECALLQHVHKWRQDYRKLRQMHPAFRVYMFDSNKKSMSTAEQLSDSTVRVYTKGAPDILIHSCTHELCSDGETVRPLSDKVRDDINRAVENMASHGLRTLLLAVHDDNHDTNDEDYWAEAPIHNLAFVGVVGIKDPVRPETKEAVRQLKEAGVTVRMVTGDNALTARFIAKESGILDEDGIVMEGPRFRALSDEELERNALRIQVLARSTPNDKLLLVRKLKKLGEVTSVTGDGTNDGPALKEADVGFALGIAGTEVAKEACDIVILDDNIQSMTKAVLWGRNVYESIRKFLQFQLVVNVVAVTLNFISACAGRALPLGAVPLLWVNMIMDSMGALALATEPPRDELLKRKPYGRRAPLINRAMYRNIVGISLFQLAVSLALQYAGHDIFNLDSASDAPTDLLEDENLQLNSIIFNVFVFMQIGSEINSRRIASKDVFSGIFKSAWFLSIIAVTIVIQLALMFGVGRTDVGRSIGITTINGPAWGASIILGLLILPWGYLVRLFPLDWCFGPTDEDPLEMSKLERLLRLPKRKPHVDKADQQDEEPVDADSGPIGSTSFDLGAIDSVPDTKKLRQGAVSEVTKVYRNRDAQSESLHRLRVFVHAVAFVNVVSRGTMSNRDEASEADRVTDNADVKQS